MGPGSVATDVMHDLQRVTDPETGIRSMKEPELIELKPDLAGVPLSKRREIGREDREALLTARKIRNRESASRSRARTAVYVKDLEKEIVKLKDDVVKLRADHISLQREFHSFKRGLAQKTGQRQRVAGQQPTIQIQN